MALGKKTGGRKRGTKNKVEKPVKITLQAHSLDYITPDETGVSQLERDLTELTPTERVTAEIKLLKFHTAEMKSVDATATVENRLTIEDQLRELAEED